MFPIYGAKCLSRKAFHSSVANASLMTKRFEEAEATAKRHLCCGFRRIIKRCTALSIQIVYNSSVTKPPDGV
jgi:hypothetical protein